MTDCAGDRKSHAGVEVFTCYFLHAEKDSTLRVAFLSNSEEKETRPFALQVKIYAEEGSRVELTMPQMLGTEVLDLTDIGRPCWKKGALCGAASKCWARARKRYIPDALMDLEGRRKLLHRPHRLSGFYRPASRYELCGPPSGQEDLRVSWRATAC